MALVALGGVLLYALNSSGDRTPYVGVWVASRQLPPDDLGDAFVKLDLKREGRFHLTDSGIPVEGLWNVKGNTILLVPDTFMGKPISDRMEIVPRSSDYKLEVKSYVIYYTTNVDKAPIRLERVPM
jgi:hypothetical protein